MGLVADQDKRDVFQAWTSLQRQSVVVSPYWIGQGAAALNSLDALIRKG